MKSIMVVVLTFLVCLGINFIDVKNESSDEANLNGIVSKVSKSQVLALQEKYNNLDIKGYLDIPGTMIHEPVLQGEDNSFYLSHNVYKKKNVIGSLFLDYRVNINEKKTIIYGHNSSTLKTPFQELEKYYEKDYWDKHQDILLSDINGISRYKIFSVFVETQDWSYMQLDFDDEKWIKHLEDLQEKSWYETGVKVSKEDEILILQTCSHHSKYKKYSKKYLLVVAKKVN